MHIKCRYFSRKNLATGGVGPPPQMPLTVKENIEGNANLHHPARNRVKILTKGLRLLTFALC